VAALVELSPAAEEPRDERSGSPNIHSPLLATFINDAYEASLEKGKLYRVIPDEEAEAHGYLMKKEPNDRSILRSASTTRDS